MNTGRSIYFIGALAHWAIYTALLVAIIPAPGQPATWVLCATVGGVGAWFWPVLDYALTGALAFVSILCAICVVSAVLAAVWLSCRLAEQMEQE